jgi:hypothetical protein
MKTWFYIFGVVAIGLASCKDDEIAVFDKTSDERAAEAIANLKQELVAPSNGWIVKYRPEAESGSFYVLMDFNEDNTVNIKTDLGNNDGEFFDKTLTYRIDNSLGLELILESHSFFSFLFEQNAATFLAEYEFNFVNKTPDNALVFNSKTDPDTPTILLFQEAAANDIDLLGTEVSTNLNIITADLNKFSTSLKMTYEDRDLVFYLVMDNFRRIININSASRKTNTLVTEDVNFTSPYILKGDSIVFDSGYSDNVLNNNISIKGIKFTDLTDGTLNVCADPITIHSYEGVTSADDAVTIETSLLDASGGAFADVSDFYIAPLDDIVNNGESASAQIAQDITGALAMQLYYNYDIGNGQAFYAIGFYIQNSNGTVTFALRRFTPTLTENNLVFAFEPDVELFGEPTTDANVENVNIYLDLLSQGDNTYVFQLPDGRYEFHNPCTGWSFIFFNGN